MDIDKNTLERIAHLARLELDPDKEEEMLRSLSEILTWVEKLNELNTDEVEPLTNMSQEINALKDDEVGEHLDREQGLSSAPARDDRFFKVPKVKD